MKGIAISTYGQAEVRTIIIDDAPHWVAKDIATILGYKNSNDAISKHCKGVAKYYPLATDGGIQEVRVIGESDLYRLIAKSKLPSAEKFEAWIFEEVLPQIRKTGSYGQETTIDIHQALNDPASLRNLLLANVEKVIALEGKVAEQAPKVAALDRISTADGMMCITDAAKVLNMKPKALFAYLSAKQWIYRRVGGKNWLGYQAKIQAGLVDHKVQLLTLADGTEKIRESVYLTAKGIAFLAKVFAVPSKTVKAVPVQMTIN